MLKTSALRLSAPQLASGKPRRSLHCEVHPASNQSLFIPSILSRQAMVWGQKQGVDDLAQRLAANDPKLMSLTVMRFRQFGHEEVTKLCESLVHNTVLTELYASGHKMEPRTAQIVAAMLESNSTLTSLCIGDDEFGDEGVEALLKGIGPTSAIQRLDLENKGMSPGIAASLSNAITKSRSLKSVLLARNALKDSGVQSLCINGLGSLTELDLRECDIGSKACAALAEGFKLSPALEVVWLEDNPQLGGEDPSAMAEMLAAASSIRELHLRNAGISEQGLSAVKDAMDRVDREELSWQLLDISECALGTSGGSALAKVLPKASQLRRLLLRDTQLSDEGAASVVDGLPPSVSELDLGQNKLTASGLGSLKSCMVAKLSLFANSLGDAGASALAELSSQQGGFSSLEELDVSGCEISLIGMKALSSALQQGSIPALKVMLVGANPAVQDDDWEAALEELRQSRPSIDVAWQTNDPGEAGR